MPNEELGSIVVALASELESAAKPAKALRQTCLYTFFFSSFYVLSPSSNFFTTFITGLQSTRFDKRKERKILNSSDPFLE